MPAQFPIRARQGRIPQAALQLPEDRFPRLAKRVQWDERELVLNQRWWKRPEKIRILMYMDGGSFSGSNFSLDHAIDAITSDPWPWATFDVTTAHRFADSTADHDNATFTSLDLDDFDQVWIFGFSSATNILSNNEIAAIEDFMDDGGGVFTTGDHANLGRGVAGAVKRIGKLRAYPAPQALAPQWNTTLVDANGDGSFNFNEQSDATPQIIRPRYWYSWSGGPLFGLKKFPHPVLCSEQGPLRKLPDHQHEGQVVIPSSFPVAEWPKSGSFQPKPEVIAWGRIIDPDAENTGSEFPVIGAYDGHGAGVGRIVADSTWHHWFNINMQGFDPLGQDYKDITSYFQNVAAWLAPKGKQAGMRNGVFWLALHQPAFQQANFRKLPLSIATKTARDAIGRYAPQCFVHSWIWPLLTPELQVQLATLDPIGPKIKEPVEDTILVEALTSLQEHFDMESGIVRAAGGFEIVEESLRKAVPTSVTRLVTDCEENLKSARRLLEPSLVLVEPSSDSPSSNGQRNGSKAKAKADA